MSASALKLSAKLVPGLFLAGVLVGACAELVCAQTPNSVTAAQVAQMVASIRTASPAELSSLNAVTVGQKLLGERRYSEAYQLFSALRDRLPQEPVVLYGLGLASFNLGRPAEAEPLARAAAETY